MSKRYLRAKQKHLKHLNEVMILERGVLGSRKFNLQYKVMDTNLDRLTRITDDPEPFK